MPDTIPAVKSEVKPTFLRVNPDDGQVTTAECRICGPLHSDELSWKEALEIRDEHNLFHERNTMPDSKVPIAVGYMVFHRRPHSRDDGSYVYDPASSFFEEFTVVNALVASWAPAAAEGTSYHAMQLLAMPHVPVVLPEAAEDVPIAQEGEGEDG